MINYIKTFKYITYYMLFFSLFFGFFAIYIQKPVSLVFFTLYFLIWLNTYYYLKKRTPRAFMVSYSMINLFWFPLLYRTTGRISFIFENKGMERIDGSGSPMAFLLGFTFEQIFFIPLSILVIYGLFFILSKEIK